MKLFGFEIGRAQPAQSQELVATAEPKARAFPTMKSIAKASRMLFNSGDSNRLTGDWSTTPQPADWIIAKHLRALVARSREQAVNNDYMKAYLRLCRQNIVGATGVMFQSKALGAGGKLDQKNQRAVERAFREWAKRKHCDIAGKLSWRAIQLQCVETAARDGEFFLQKIFGSAAGKFGFALAVIDPMRCPVDYNVDKLKNGNHVRAGIEYNSFGRPVAYYFVEADARNASQAYTYGGRAHTRIPADQIVHGFVQEIVGQKRGLPWLATGLFRMKQMSAFEDAAIVNARVGAAKLGVIKFEPGYGPQYDENVGIDIDSEPASFSVLPDGGELQKFDPAYPTGEFAPFMKQMLRSMAAGGGVSYHTLAQDLEGVNFSSIRQGTLDEREFYTERQSWLVEELCEEIFEPLFERLMLGGHVKTDTGRVIAADKIDTMSPHEWQPRRWTWIDPRADVEASVEAKNNLLSSPGQIIRESGRDPQTVWAEIGQDIAEMKSAGIPENIIELAMGLKIAPPQVKPAPPKEA